MTALELTVNEYQRRSFVKPSPEIFDSIDTLSRQTIILRRHFWRVRNIINFLVHNEQDKEEVKYIEMVYDDISQLIDFVNHMRVQSIQYVNYMWQKYPFKLTIL